MRITREQLDALIGETVFFRHGTLTISVLVLTNGAKVIGQSNVIDPATYSEALGEQFAREDAINKLWQLEGYATKTRGAA